MRFSFGFTDLMQRSDVLRWLAGLQQRHNAVLVIGINRRKWCLRRWMWSLSLASRDMATDSQPSHSQPAPISARYPVPHAEEAASQALVLGLARAMSKPREQTTTTNRNLAHPSKEPPGAGALFCGGFNTPPGATAAPWGPIMTTGLNGAGVSPQVGQS